MLLLTILQTSTCISKIFSSSALPSVPPAILQKASATSSSILICSTSSTPARLAFLTSDSSWLQSTRFELAACMCDLVCLQCNWANAFHAASKYRSVWLSVLPSSSAPRLSSCSSATSLGSLTMSSSCCAHSLLVSFKIESTSSQNLGDCCLKTSLDEYCGSWIALRSKETNEFCSSELPKICCETSVSESKSQSMASDSARLNLFTHKTLLNPTLNNINEA